MEWQLIPVGLVVAAAAWYLGIETWRTWRANKSRCGGGCGCRTDAKASDHSRGTLISTDQLTSRLHAHRRAN